ncbi:hypothetical protein DJ71_14955 [Halorubrum sp. E3]|nr:hypothetical protein DJ71_14955 [Halorubrum sp. E3]
MFETAASIRDLDLAIEMAYLLYAPGRLGPRNSEVLHVCDDYLIRNEEGTIVAYQIPTALPGCDCVICQRLATRRARDDEDDSATAEDYLDEYWTPKSHAGGRSVPVIQNRGREVLDLYAIKHMGKPNMTGQTYRNRLARLEELCDDVDVNLYPQALRATAANYWTLWGLDAKYLRWFFGWKYISTAQFYIRKSDVTLRWKMEQALGRSPTIPYEIYNEPPTFLDLRPDNPDELIDVDTLTPESASPPATSTMGDDPLEEHARIQMENANLSDYPVGMDPVSPLVRVRLQEEHEAAVESDETNYPLSPKRAAALGVGLVAFALVWGVALASSGAFLIDPVAGDVELTLGGGIGIVLGAVGIVWNTPEL